MSRALSLLRSSSDCFLYSPKRCLHSWKCKRRVPDLGVGKVFAVRRYAASATASLPMGSTQQQRVEYLDEEEVDESRSRHSYSRRDEEAYVPYPKVRPRADPEPLVEHLRHLFPPLEFPDTVATQVLTHISAKEAWAGHNARLAFVGRRVIQSYLLLFLQEASQQLARNSSPPIDPDLTFDFDRIAYKASFTYLLGEYVGAQWDLARVMLWKPAVRSSVRDSPLSRSYAEEERGAPQTPGSLKSPGMYKVQGTAVEGVMGGIFHQFGGTIAQRVFHTRLLPHILCPGTPFGLHDAFHPAALEMQKRLGGPDGLLVTNSNKTAQRRSSSTEERSSPSSASASEITSETQTWGARTPLVSSETAQPPRKRIFS